MRLLFLLFVAGISAFNLTSIEKDCHYCVNDTLRAYIKVITSPQSKPIYLCHRYSLIISQFVVAVDRACSPEQCVGMEEKPISRVLTSDELSCSNKVYSSSNSDETVHIVKDCLEILIIFVLFFVLVVVQSDIRRKRFKYDNHLETSV